MKKILNDTHHNCCEFLKNLNCEILSELNFCDNKKFSKNKEFVKCEILIRKKYNYDMYLLDRLIEVAEGENKEHTFENLNQKP